MNTLLRMHDHKSLDAIFPRPLSAYAVEQKKKDVLLRDDPDAFDSIFHDIRNTREDAVRKLLAAIVLTYVKDYLFGHTRQRTRQGIVRARARQREAEVFIFGDSPSEDLDPLSFASICKTLDVDPDYARRGIKARKREGVVALLSRLRELQREERGTSYNYD